MLGGQPLSTFSACFVFALTGRRLRRPSRGLFRHVPGLAPAAQMLLGSRQGLAPLALSLAPHATGNWSHWFPMPNEPEGPGFQRRPAYSARIVSNSLCETETNATDRECNEVGRRPRVRRYAGNRCAGNRNDGNQNVSARQTVC